MAALLNGRYELGDVLGTGGMGRVVRAHDTRLDRTVAIKLMHVGRDGEDVSRTRMHSEARLAGSLRHPGIATVFDHGEDLASGSRDPFIVMQYVEGVSLATVLRERGPLPVTEVLPIIGQVADALATAHRAGVVHRDLKPANIMITPLGRAVLVDFGIARSATSEPLTVTGAFLGTADYISPEQVAGRQATPRSDLYALGVVAHHALGGRSPFRRESSIGTALAHLNDPVPPLPPSVPRAAVALVLRLTAKRPDDRPATASAVVQLAAAASVPDRVATPTPPPRLPALSTAGPPPPPAVRPPPPPSLRPPPPPESP